MNGETLLSDYSNPLPMLCGEGQLQVVLGQCTALKALLSLRGQICINIPSCPRGGIIMTRWGGGGAGMGGH